MIRFPLPLPGLPLSLLLLTLPALAAAQQVDSAGRVATIGVPAGITVTTLPRDSMALIPRGPMDSASRALAAPHDPDSIFHAAQQLITAGQSDSGRALVQAQLDSARMGSPQYVHALYWRAVLASTAAGAERDLRTIVVEYPLAPESADALMRLSQLEMARGDRHQALEHLDRLLLEHPNSPDRARAGFWMARMLFRDNRPRSACARLEVAQQQVAPGDVELLNQINYLAQRCFGVDTSSVAEGGDSTTDANGIPASGGVPAGESAMGSGASTASARNGATSAPTPTGRYTIQVAAFRHKDSAVKERARLMQLGFDTRIVEGGNLFRVRVGKFDTRADAEAMIKRLKVQHIDGLVTKTEGR
ncbi:MAG TPA: SPOR domain-containing protein [Gemmatimonadaceae bacterium]|nr:SPOR domain-containing protein [Gemmatimonadaceae bacterium]